MTGSGGCVDLGPGQSRHERINITAVRLTALVLKANHSTAERYVRSQLAAI